MKLANSFWKLTNLWKEALCIFLVFFMHAGYLYTVFVHLIQCHSFYHILSIGLRLGYSISKALTQVKVFTFPLWALHIVTSFILSYVVAIFLWKLCAIFVEMTCASPTQSSPLNLSLPRPVKQEVKPVPIGKDHDYNRRELLLLQQLNDQTSPPILIPAAPLHQKLQAPPSSAYIVPQVGLLTRLCLFYSLLRRLSSIKSWFS